MAKLHRTSLAMSLKSGRIYPWRRAKWPPFCTTPESAPSILLYIYKSLIRPNIVGDVLFTFTTLDSVQNHLCGLVGIRYFHPVASYPRTQRRLHFIIYRYIYGKHSVFIKLPFLACTATPRHVISTWMNSILHSIVKLGVLA